MPCKYFPILSENKSNFLNNLRWLCAILVLAGHTELYARLILTEQNIKSFSLYHYLTQHAHVAVIIFFVLSGYLVGYATYRKLAIAAADLSRPSYTFTEYFLDRWSRIYSVLLIALLFTIFLDFIGSFLSENYFNSEYIPQEHKMIRIIVNLFSLQGIQGYRVQFGSNPALWSIGYEFCYYMIFGMFVFRKRLFSSLLFSSLIFAALGLKMFGYFLIWIIGFISFYAFHKLDLKISHYYTAPLLVVLVIGNHFLVYCKVLSISEYSQDVLIAMTVALILLCNGRNGKPNTYSRLVNKFFADFSYSIYAYHLPIIFFYYSIMPISASSFPFICHSIILIVLCICISRMLYYLSESRRIMFRNTMRNILNRCLCVRKKSIEGVK